MSYFGSLTSTNLWLRTASHANLAMVLWIDGVDLGFTTTDDVAGLSDAWENVTSSEFSNLRGGLSIAGAVDRNIQLFAAKIEPSNLTFEILDAQDELLPLMYGDSRTDILRTRLAASVDNNDTVIPALDVTKIPGTPPLYIGHEQLTPSAVDTGADTWNVTRGQNSLFETEDGSDFSRGHEVDPEGAAAASPEITNMPTKWFNRHVGLYLCHKVNGVWSAGFPGSSSSDAELLWCGRIKSYSEEGDGKVIIDCVEVLEQLKSSVGTRLYEGSLQQGTYINAGEEDGYVAIERYSIASGTYESYASGTFSMSSLTDTQVTHQEIAREVNAALGTLFSAGSGTYGPSTIRLSLALRDGRYGFVWSDSQSPITHSYRVRVYLHTPVWEMLGWRNDTGKSLYGSTGGLGGTIMVQGIAVTGDAVAPQPPLTHRPPSAETATDTTPIVIEDVGDWEFVPQTRIPAEFDQDCDGFLLIDGKHIIAVKESSPNNFLYRGQFPSIDGGDLAQPELFTRASEDAAGGVVSVSQVWIEPGTIGETMLRLLVSTGTPGYNHETYDELPKGMGLGIPWSLIDSDGWLGLGSDPYLLVVSKSTPATKLIESALNVTGRHVAWKDGAITAVQPVEGGVALVTLDETNKATEIVKDGRALVPFRDRVKCVRNPEGIINRITLKYHPTLDGTFKRTIDVVGVQSQSDYDEVRSVVVDGYGLYDGFSGAPEPLNGGAATWVQNVASPSLTYFGKPLSVIERSYDFSVAADLYPGAKVELDDDGLINPATGSRGVTGLLCWVVSAKFDWLTGVGIAQLVFSPSSVTTSDTVRTALWAPSARVDETVHGSSVEQDASTALYYKFDTTVAGNYTTVADTSGGSRTLTAVGEPTGVSGNYQQIINGPISSVYARWMPGVSGSGLFRAGDATALTLFTTGAYTIEMWARLDAASADYGLFLYVPSASATTNNWILRWFASGSTRRQIAQWESGVGTVRTTSQTVGTQWTVGTWHHFALSVDLTGATATIKFYLDGVLGQTVAGVTKPAVVATPDIYLGGGPGVTFYGARTSVHVSNIARSDAAIAASAALSGKQHSSDGNTFALWQLQEAPDARDESTYGYHLRKISGTFTSADPLEPGGIKSRTMDATTEYSGHFGYEPLRACLTGSAWTWEAWLKMSSGYDAAYRGVWCYGDPGPETLATNFLSMEILGPGAASVLQNRAIRLLFEHDGGVNNVQDSVNPIFTDVNDGLIAHHVAITFSTSGATKTLKFYKDAALLETLQFTDDAYEGGTSAFLRVSAGGAGTQNPLLGTIDEARWSTVARTPEEIAEIVGARHGYSHEQKKLWLKAHEYTAASEVSTDVSYFQVGDKIHIVDLSPTDPNDPVDWVDTIAARDTTENTITLTTGLASPTWPDRGHFVVEWDDVQTVTATQLLRGGFISDATTESTGNEDDDAYLWAGDVVTYPSGLEYDQDERYRRLDNTADNTGEPASVHKLHELRDFANMAIVHHSNPVYISHANIGYGSDENGYSTIYGPVWIPLYSGRVRALNIKALLQPHGEATYRFKTSRNLPSSSDADFENPTYVNTTFHQVSTTPNEASPGVVSVSLDIDNPDVRLGATIGCWFTVDVLEVSTTANPVMLALRVAERGGG